MSIRCHIACFLLSRAGSRCLLIYLLRGAIIWLLNKWWLIATKHLRNLACWQLGYINLNCFSNHQLQWKWFQSLLPNIIKIITIYYGFSYSVTSKSCENTTSSNMSWIFMLIIWIHYFIHHTHEYLNNILNLNATFIF